MKKPVGQHPDQSTRPAEESPKVPPQVLQVVEIEEEITETSVPVPPQTEVPEPPAAVPPQPAPQSPVDEEPVEPKPAVHPKPVPAVPDRPWRHTPEPVLPEEAGDDDTDGQSDGQEETDDEPPQSDEVREEEREMGRRSVPVVSELFHKDRDEAESEDKYPEVTLSEEKTMKPVMFWAIALIVAVVIIGGALIALKRGNLNIQAIPVLPKPTLTPTPAPTTAPPTPTPTPSFVKKDLKIKVLNGSGVKGVAGEMKKALEDKGYTVSATGNADEFNYAETVVRVGAGKEDVAKAIASDLSGTYTVGSTKTDLPKSAGVDAEVIVGKK